MVRATEAFKEHGLKHTTFEAKEHLGLLNGTAFSAAVASLALNDAAHVALLAQVATAMGTEALLGTQGSSSCILWSIGIASNSWSCLLQLRMTLSSMM